MHAWNGGGYGPGAYAAGFPWGGLVMGLVFLALVALVVVLIVRKSKAVAPSIHDARARGLEILTERFARGEIDAATFRLMKAELDAKE